MSREKYPVALSLMAIVLTSAALCAAALDIQWGASPVVGDALLYAWLYAHVAAAFTWLVLWPVAALRSRPGEHLAWRELLWSFAALWAGLLPALSTAAVLSSVPAETILTTLAFQLALSVFAWGVLALTGRATSPAVRALLAGLPATLVVAAPIAVFLCSEFFPRASLGWQYLLPLPLLARTARPAADWPPHAGFWLVMLGDALVGVLALVVASRGNASASRR